MSIRMRLVFLTACMSALVLMAVGTQAQEMTGQPGTNMAAMKFMTVPPVPTCARGAVASGDPSKGASVLLLKASAGCVIPWHWHTPNENVMIVSGVVSLQMKDDKPVTLTSGAFALMPSHHAHYFKCARGPCAVYVYSDAAFDIHYVDKSGNEMTPADALKVFREKPATEMK